jgi:hypothetical protein
MRRGLAYRRKATMSRDFTWSSHEAKTNLISEPPSTRRLETNGPSDGICTPHATALKGTSAGQFLAAVFSNPCARIITKPPGDGHSWRSEFKAWNLASIAAAIYISSLIVGIRPEGLLRLLVIDIDRKPNQTSPYWHPSGRSRQLLALEGLARAAGCGFSLLRSSASGGLHVCILLPAAIPAWQAYWVGQALITAAGMKEGSGRCELFPSRLDFCDSADRSRWAKSNGFRLPGQEGSALIIGDNTATDTDLIYQELLVELQQAEPVLGWHSLLQNAIALKRSAAASSHFSRRRNPSKHNTGVRWTGAGQSEENLRRITRWARSAHPEAQTIHDLGAIIRRAAWDSPGFIDHASDTTKSDLSGRRGDWAERWARCSLRSSRPRNFSAPKSRDKHHNKRLIKLSQAKLTRAWRDDPAAAAQWSKRMVAKIAVLSRQVVDKHWGFWLQLVGGQHPPITGGAKTNTSVSPVTTGTTSPLQAPPTPRRSTAPDRYGFVLIAIRVCPDDPPINRVVPFNRHSWPGAADQCHSNPPWPGLSLPPYTPSASLQRFVAQTPTAHIF